MNLYVSNVSFHTTEEDLNKMFAAYGNVSSVKIITDKMTNKSRGFAFIEMPNDAEAEEAIKTLNGKDVQGRSLSVAVARPKENNGFRNKSRW